MSCPKCGRPENPYWGLVDGVCPVEDGISCLTIQLSRLTAELATAKAQSERRRALIEKHQWRYIRGYGHICPSCFNDKETGHAADCAIAREIQEK